MRGDNRHRVSFCSDKNVLKLDCDDVAQPYEYTENHWTVHFNRVNVLLRELYLNLKKVCLSSCIIIAYAFVGFSHQIESILRIRSCLVLWFASTE